MAGEAETGLGEFFWRGLEEGRMLFQRCEACRRLRYPPSARCPDCGGLETSIAESAGEGTLFSFTILERPKLVGWTLPLTVALVALDEGVRILGPLDREIQPRLGMRLSARIEPTELGPRPLRFVAAEPVR